MTEKTTPKRPTPPNASKELVVRRTIRAPRERVFRAWASADAVARWWGPDGFSTGRCEVDFRPGGRLHIEMVAPDGVVYPMAGEFREVDRPSRIVLVGRALDPAGATLFESLVTVTLSETPDGTAVEVRAKVLSTTDGAAPYLQGMEAGWTQQVGRWDQYARGEVV